MVHCARPLDSQPQKGRPRPHSSRTKESTLGSSPALTAQSTPSRRSILSELGEAPSAGVTGGQLEWSGAYDWDGNYTLSLRNDTEYVIRDIAVFVIFHDRSGNPIETDAIIFPDLVPPGLARRATGSVHPSIKRLTTNMRNVLEYNRTPATRVDIRVLNYDIVN